MVYVPTSENIPNFQSGEVIKPDYQLSYFEFLLKYATVITGSGGGGTGTYTIYTVPANSVFYLLSVAVNGWTDVDNTFANLESVSAGGVQAIIGVRYAAHSNDSNSMNFSVPLKFNTAEIFQLTVGTGGTGTSTAQIVGLLVPKIHTLP